MVDTQRVNNIWLYKEEFSAEGWTQLLDNFGVGEDIRDRTFAIDIWDADVIAKPAREEDY